MECNVSPEIRVAISSMHAKRNTITALYRGWEPDCVGVGASETGYNKVYDWACGLQKQLMHTVRHVPLMATLAPIWMPAMLQLGN